MPAMADLQGETTEVLQRFIRFNTVNPPGRERAVQEYLAGYLRDAGFDCEMLAKDPDRPNLVARLGGRSDGPTLTYLSHVDTVLAHPGEWTHDPWSGDVADGFLWGRGAQDMKSQTAAEVVAAASLARAGWRPAAGDLLVLSVVDEEAGSALGAKWLAAQHPDKVRCGLLINEGGGAVFDYDGRRLFGVCCGEKGTYRFKLTTKGVAGHASMPHMGDNALLKMAPLLQRLAATQPGYDLTEQPRAMLEGLGGDPDDLAGTMRHIAGRDPRLAVFVEPMLGVTLTPTRISASEKINVIPSVAELQVDCRVPPGLGEAEAIARAREVLGDDGYEIEFLDTVPGNASPVASPLMDAIAAWVVEQDSAAGVVPTILPGYTDSVSFRSAFPDCVAYGFFPQRHMTLLESQPLVHGADERIDVRDLGFAAGFFADLAQRVLS
jgi:acetylornithine deacetylase/succinyl-diaminopimelate desuccinylase-like protein